jgi:hypothetical protein
MNRRLLHLFLAAGIALSIFGCSSKNSEEACIHKVTMDLDQGRYDAVLASACADNMQRGAAFLGRSGFDITQVVNKFSETGVVSGQTGTRSDFAVYMTALVGKVTDTSLSDMDSSKSEYTSVPADEDCYKDAQFYISIVDALKGLSLLKIVLDVDGNGLLTTKCDRNANSKPDEIDATGCSFLTSASKPCTNGASVVTSATVTFADRPGTYRGLVIQVDGAGTNISECPAPNQYKQLLFLQSSGTTSFWTPVTTTPASQCAGSDGQQWPCPLIQNGQPQDLVATINDSLDSSIDSLSTAISGTAGTDVQQSIRDLKAQACCGCTTDHCGPCQQACTSSTVADYLQTYH